MKSKWEKADGPYPWRTIILVGVLIISYFLSVLWSAWVNSTTSIFYRTLSSIPCLKTYHPAFTPGNGGPNFWFLEDYEVVYFSSAILSDPECAGKLMAAGTTFIKLNPGRHQVVIQLVDPVTMEIISKISIKP